MSLPSYVSLGIPLLSIATAILSITCLFNQLTIANLMREVERMTGTLKREEQDEPEQDDCAGSF